MLHAGEARINQSGQIVVPGVDVRVYRGDAKAPLFGSITREEKAVRFVPSLPLVAGETYRIEFQTADGRWHREPWRFDPLKTEVPAVGLAPTPAVLPANALKVYLHFTQPMEQGVFLERIFLHRQDGGVVAGAFRETELWSPDGRRLTLWFHPGRQKTGVNLNRDEGPVLREGEQCSLRVAGDWRSTAGVALGKDVTFDVTAGAADHGCPDPLSWTVMAPKAGSRDILSVRFDEPLDSAMLLSALEVSLGGKPVEGQVKAAADARSWIFTPAQAWQAGEHTIHIDPLLEDLAGNNLQHPFEVDRDQPGQAARATLLRFEVR
jgi:hypothetical protein